MGKKISDYVKISERKVLLRFFDLAFIFSSIYLASSFFGFYYLRFDRYIIIKWLLILLFYYLLFGKIFGLFSLSVSNDILKVIQSLVITAFLTTFFFVFTPFLTPSLPQDRLQIGYLFFLIVFPVFLWRVLYIILIFSPKSFKSIMIICHSSNIEEIYNLTNNNGYHRIASIISEENKEKYDFFTSIEKADLKQLVKQHAVSEIIVNMKGFSAVISKKISKKLVLLFEEGIDVKNAAQLYEEVTQSISKEYLNQEFYNPADISKNYNDNLYNLFHRTMDIIISVIGVFIFIELFPFILIFNLIANKGPLFYLQERVGFKGKTFKIFKLRTMIVDAEKDGVKYTTKGDNRITPFGNFLRKTRIDEMPQFLNILKGDMSLIGPRPERPEYVKILSEKIPFYSVRHAVKPGLTGWAQVSYPYAGTVEEQETKLRYDLYYIKKQSIFLDFVILVKTLPIILSFKGQ